MPHVGRTLQQRLPRDTNRIQREVGDGKLVHKPITDCEPVASHLQLREHERLAAPGPW